jgi:nucleoid-associated protein YgaU
MKRVLLMVAAAVFAMAMFAGACGAEEYEYREYTVRKGDTLWGIAKGQLENNYYWPMLWRENLRINNPDLIYPGQVIRIPVRVVMPGQVVPEAGEAAAAAPAMETPARVAAPAPAPVPTPAPAAQVGEAPVAEAAEEAAPPRSEAEDIMGVEAPPVILASRNMILEAGYITRKVPFQGRIMPSYIGRELFGSGDELYIDPYSYAEKGRKFYVIRQEKAVDHPDTAEDMGFVIRILGVVETLEGGAKGVRAHVLETLHDIKAGDIIDNYYEVESVVDIPPRRPAIEGFVVASRAGRVLNAERDLLFIDKGRRDGAEVGDEFLTLMPRTDDRRNATIRVVDVREETSLCVVVGSEREVERGHSFVQVW